MLDIIKREEDEAVAQGNYEYASQLVEQKANLQAKLTEAMAKKGGGEQHTAGKVVDEESVAQVVSMWTGIPVTRMSASESERLLQMEEILKQKVVGQDEVISVLSKAIRRAKAGLKDPRRPIGVFMTLGPTGVGKTHVVRKLAEFLYGNEDAMVRLDMSEFMERHTVARLVGAPPGYVGYDDGGQLTEAVRRKSYCVILLDEIEKAHPDVFNILLQIFDDGHLTDARGRKVNFRNTIIVMTSNLGSNLMYKGTNIGFAHDESARASYNAMKEQVLSEVGRFFRPEFLNRIDSTVVFHALEKNHIVEIVRLMIKEVALNLKEKGIGIEVTEEAAAWLAKKGYDPQFGARPLRRTIQAEIEDRLSEYVLQGSLASGATIIVDCKEDVLVFDTSSKAKELFPEITQG
jgi:ATP-dependent Clp protease ATP-binding subunit ClpC